MKLNKTVLKSNKAFTLQDLSIAIMILMLFVGTIGSTYVIIYKTQADTQIDSIATIYAVQIMEYIDKIAYEEITTDTADTLINTIKEKFSISSTFQIALEITPENNEQDLVKTVKLTLSYTFSEEERNIVIERLKVKEL